MAETQPKVTTSGSARDAGVDLKAVEKAVADAPAAVEPVAVAKAGSRTKKPISKTSAGKKKARVGKPTPITKPKDTVMATANPTTDFAATAKDAAAKMQNRAKAAVEKGTVLTGEITEFHKGNLEALVETGKLLASGMQDMGRTYMEDARTAADTVTEDVKKMAAIKSPTELFQLQGEIARRNFDAAVAQTSKSTEAMMKLVTEAFAPLSNRASVAAEKVSNAA